MDRKRTIDEEHNEEDDLVENDQATNNSIIVDNRSRANSVVEFLHDSITPNSKLSIVSAYFTIYGYGSLKDKLNQIHEARFLYGEPRSKETPDPANDNVKSFDLDNNGGLAIKNILSQKSLAKECSIWIKDKVQVRTITRPNFLHGKLYCLESENRTIALVGSSNFTARGLGHCENPNIEINTKVRDQEGREQLACWFDDLWSDQDLTQDVKDDVLNSLERLYRAYSPQFIYYKTLFHIFKDDIDRRIEHENQLQQDKLQDTPIWKSLYKFQQQGAIVAIECLKKHNGCIIADSVGLGKTLTALAIIRYFEMQNRNVLVLCPKRLHQNWICYTGYAAQKNNPYEKDRFNYTVLAHTDLSRYEGTSGNIDLANFNWGGFGLIVIDESHNFRNEGRELEQDDGTIRLSRYKRLLKEVLKEGVQTKVLMLSATPINTGVRDLRNQINLMNEARDDAFKDSLGIASLESMFRKAQRSFQTWEGLKGNKYNKASLLSDLGVDFLSLLDTVTIARSRQHIKKYYLDDERSIGGFPERKTPSNVYAPTDIKQSISYEELMGIIDGLGLAVYRPANYLKDNSESENGEHPFTQKNRERSLVAMMRVNLLKRLESSVNSYLKTVIRILDYMMLVNERIDKWQKLDEDRTCDEFSTQENMGLEDDEIDNDEDFTVGKKRTYPLSEIDVENWKKEIIKDIHTLTKLRDQARKINPQRDAKLHCLKGQLKDLIDSGSKLKRSNSGKVIIFTAFSDTASYLFENIKIWIKEHYEQKVHVAVITGRGDGESTIKDGKMDFTEILGRFSPKAQNFAVNNNNEIDLLIATDCISEGQNLQDCDLVINYDIHWNPVRLMQRFGRIDRIGSHNRRVSMINFWPTKDLDKYLKLGSRVEARMALMDVTATGGDDPLAPAQSEINFRDDQLKRIQKEYVDIDNDEETISLTDFTLSNFIADLMAYIQKYRAELETAPLGIYAIVSKASFEKSKNAHSASNILGPGVIFCLKKNYSADSKKTPNRIWPYFLVYVYEDGSVKLGFEEMHKCLTLFQEIASSQSIPDSSLEDIFEIETNKGQAMDKYEKILDSAMKNINNSFRKAELANLRRESGAKLTNKDSDDQEFTLVTWLVIAD